jgi:hypothetical protein
MHAAAAQHPLVPILPAILPAKSVGYVFSLNNSQLLLEQN